MGDIKKAAKWAIPVILAFATGGLTAAGGFGFLASMSAIEGAMLGSALVGLMSGKKKGPGAAAPVYGLGNPANTQSPHLAIPIIYGEMRVPGNLVYNLKAAGQIYKWPVIFCQGEIESIEKVFINNYKIDEWTGCSSDEYTGTLAQTNNARFPDYLGSLKKKAYSACTVQASEELQGNATITGLVKGRKVPVYNGAAWNTEWSDNYIWVMRDALITLGGMAEADMGADATWYAEAQHCDEAVTGEYDIGDNLMLAGTLSGSTNPETANDGNLRPIFTAGNYWYVAAPQSETMVKIGEGDLGSTKSVKRVRLHLFDGDSREYYNYKITYSTDNISYSTLIDRTGSGKSYSGRQDILLEIPISARYFKIYGSGSTDSAIFHVKEFEVFEAVAAKRYRASAYVRDAGSAASIIDAISLAAPARVVENKGKVYVKIDRALGGGSTAGTFDDSNIVADSLTISEIPRREVANYVEMKFIDPWNDWNLRSVYASDVVGQEDNGIIKKDIAVESITNEPQALRMTQLSLNLANVVRFYVSFEAGLNAVQITPGDIIDHDFDPGHWAQGLSQYLRVVSVSENPETGTRRLHCIEHFEALYDDAAATSTNSSYERTPYVDPFKQAPGQVSALALSESEVQPGDGAWIPTIEATWTNPADPWFGHCLIDISTDGGTTYDEIGKTAGEFFLIGELQAGTEYYVRVRTVSEYGISGPVTAAQYGNITLAGKASAPSNVGGFGYSVSIGTLELAWNTAVDINNDLSYYEIRDGASWAAGVVLGTEIKATRWALIPTKRTYQLWIKAFDRSGNESAAATELNISIAAPQVAGVPDAYQIPPTKIRTQFACVANNLIIRYDIHAATSGAGFTPDATTLLSQAAPSRTGLGVGEFKGVVGSTYYIKVCAIDMLSDAVGDQYSHPSSNTSKIVRLIEGGDIIANTILTNHLSTSGIDVGGDGSKPIYIRVADSGGVIIGYIGEFEWDSVDRYGGRFEDLIVGSDGDPGLVFLEDGTGYVKRSLNIGGTTDRLISNAESPGNIIPNGGFEQIKAAGTAGSDADFLPGWTWSRDTAAGGLFVFTGGVQGRYSARLDVTVASRSWLTSSEYIPVAASQKYQLSLYEIISSASPAIDLILNVVEYNSSKVQVASTSVISEAISNDSAWERLTGSVTTNASTKFIKLQLIAGDYPPAGTNSLYIDSIQCEPGNEVSAYTEPSISSEQMPLGMALNAGLGLQIFASGAERVRLGDISGMDDGNSGTVPASTMGAWIKGGFYFLDSGGNAMITASGATEDAFVSDTIGSAVFKTATRDSINGIVAEGTISLTATWPQTVTVAYDAVDPIVSFRWRAYDTGTETYSQWMVGGGAVNYLNGGVNQHTSRMNCWAWHDGSNIKVRFLPNVALHYVSGSGGISSLAQLTWSSANDVYFWLLNAALTAYTTIYDTAEVEYQITAAGELS